MNQKPEFSLLEHIQAGNQAAFRQCIDVYGKLVWSLALRLSPTPYDAEDAIQDIFLEIWRNACRFQPAQGSEEIFITVIARRRLIDRLRRNERRAATEPLIEASLESTDDVSKAEQESDSARAAKILSELEPQQQKVLILSVIYGYTHSEIATRLGLPLGTVKTHVCHGLIKIRAAMEAKPMKNRLGA